ncbi:MAG: FAD-dependent oxidoreductase, partial [Flavonifractor plautii]
MELNLASTCDVLVLGSGIAGISAALTAAESGASVILVCKGRLFSGSSFYPGTWGLGLVGPADEADEADLISTIEDVGCGMADDALVRALVK